MTRLTQLPDGSWAEPPPPARCPACKALWDDSGDTVLVGSNYGRRTVECRACGHVHGVPGGVRTVGPMNTPDHGMTRGGMG